MSDPTLRELTASEPLTLQEEYEMQSESAYGTVSSNRVGDEQHIREMARGSRQSAPAFMVPTDLTWIRIDVYHTRLGERWRHRYASDGR